MSQPMPTVPSPRSHPSKHVLMITDGESLRRIADARECRQPVRFRFIPGLFCPSVNGEKARIQPQLISSMSMAVYIDESSEELENPCGISLAATVCEVPQYNRQMYGDCEAEGIKIVKRESRIIISYNHDLHTGGFVIGLGMPLINSLSRVSRIYVKGASFYEVDSTAVELPVTNHLHPFSEQP